MNNKSNIMNIENILSTKERVAILRNVIYSDRQFGVNEIAGKLGLSKGLVSKYFEILEKEKILERNKGKFAVRNGREVKAIRILFNLNDINTNVLKRYKFVKAAGLYGSGSKGTNTESSDVDLWVKIEDAEDEKIAALTSALRKSVKNVRVLVLDDKKIRQLRKEDPVFYHSLYFGSVILYGQEDAL
jgi:predicted nucleotidyltransferase